MDVRVALQWFDGEPSLVAEEGPDGIRALVDPRLSDNQVKAACAEIGADGDAVLHQWRSLVGLTPEAGLAR